MCDIMDIAEWYPITTDCLQPEKGNCLSHAVCDDSVALMPLIQTSRTIRLFTTVFVLAVEFTRDDAMSGGDQGTVRK